MIQNICADLGTYSGGNDRPGGQFQQNNQMTLLTWLTFLLYE